MRVSVARVARQPSAGFEPAAGGLAKEVPRVVQLETIQGGKSGDIIKPEDRRFLSEISRKTAPNYLIRHNHALLSSDEESRVFDIYSRASARRRQLKTQLKRANGDSERVRNEMAQMDSVMRLASEIAIGSVQHIVRNRARLIVNFGLGVREEDLVQAANMEVHRKAVPKFKLKRGNKFSTYAQWWIWSAMTKELTKTANTIYVPMCGFNKARTMAKMKRAEMKAGSLDDHADPYVSPVIPTFSMNQPLKGDDANTHTVALLRGLADTGTPNALENVLTEDDNALANGLLGALDKKKEDIIKHAFGIGGMEIMTLKKLGEDYGLSHERIRQLKEEGLDKMRRQAGIMKTRFEADTEETDARCQQ
ncbi:sigma-70 family RNA polymerase sigma factor [Candidatus Micrarchaeota archaeon]|nr:sigma-70 family RNA polymerase sigma factor [Candidatus Micrarchaeota archaeon]